MKYLFLISVSLLLQGCITGNTGGYFMSSNGMKTAIAGDNIIIDDVISTMKRYYPPAQTTFALFLPKEDAFSKKFVAALRREGYAVSLNEGRLGYIPLAYKIGYIGRLTRMTLNIKKLQYSRVYQQQGTSLVPYSPITMRGVEDER